MNVECNGCGHRFTAPWVKHEGRKGGGWTRESLTCPECGHDHFDSVCEAVREGRVIEKPGVGVYNAAAAEKLLYRGEADG